MDGETRVFDVDAAPVVVPSGARYRATCRCGREMLSLTLLPVMLLCDRCEPDPSLRVYDPGRPSRGDAR